MADEVMDTVKEWRARVRSVLRVFLVAAGLAMPCFADTVYDCFEVKLYSPSWHVKSTLDGFTDKIDIAIDDNVHNDGMRLTITSIIIPNSISNIGYKAFSGCTGITSFSVPSSVTNISESAFFDCNYLQTLSLHDPATIVFHLPDARWFCNWFK